jgi:hypothetical protein
MFFIVLALLLAPIRTGFKTRFLIFGAVFDLVFRYNNTNIIKVKRNIYTIKVLLIAASN